MNHDRLNDRRAGVLSGPLVQSLACANQEIAVLELKKDTLYDTLTFKFANDVILRIWDDGQDCCESRYMTTDDDLQYFVGSRFMDIWVQEGPGVLDKGGDSHETEFLIIRTSLGEFTMVTHNEHNGWYGGFSLKAVIGSEKEIQKIYDS